MPFVFLGRRVLRAVSGPTESNRKATSPIHSLIVVCLFLILYLHPGSSQRATAKHRAEKSVPQHELRSISVLQRLEVLQYPWKSETDQCARFELGGRSETHYMNRCISRLSKNGGRMVL